VVRLATHLLLIEEGRTLASGPLAELMSQPDLPWLREAVGLGSVLDATVHRTHPSRGLVEIAFDGGALLASARTLTPGMSVRLRIPAREVILATDEPKGLSVHNVLAGTVSLVHADPAFEHVVVQLAVGATRLLAEVTRDAVARLGIAAGQRLYALIKSVSIDVLPMDGDVPFADRESEPAPGL
jgi:molybdate transport system ATP-binding protein